MKRIFALCVVGLMVISHSFQAQTWTSVEVQPMPMKIANNAVTEAFVNGMPYLYSFGGIDSTKIFSGISNKSFKYNVTSNTWDTIPPLPDPMKKIAAAASYVNGVIYIIGGYTVFANGNEVSSNKIHRYDVAADTFLTDGVNIPVPIDDQVQAVYKDSLIYVVTGWSNTTNVQNVQIYDTYLNTWSVGTQLTFNQYRVFGSTGIILGDTLYYYGGAERSFNFPASNYIRKGAIDPNNPTQITWSLFIPNPLIRAYRPASTTVGNRVFWIGGSSTSYNYNGIAYNGTGGVQPSNRSIAYNTQNGQFSTSMPSTGFIPMDLRGIASISDSVKYLAGGMDSNQQVTNKCYRLTYQISTTIVEQDLDQLISIFPNPSKNWVRIKNGSVHAISYQLLNGTGKLIRKGELLPQSVGELDLVDLKAGIYFVKIIDANQLKLKKLIIL